MKDISGIIFLKLRSYHISIISCFSKVTMEIKLKLMQVKAGKGLRFYGLTYISRFPNSTISIDDFAAFRSDATSNLIGVNHKCFLSTHSNGAILSIGKNNGFSGTVIAAKNKIILGDNVLCGANTLLTDFDWHGLYPDNRRTYGGDSKPIIIENNVFIGYGAIVLKGVTIGENTVIGANSVVTRNIPANVIAGGNPCKVLKNLY